MFVSFVIALLLAILGFYHAPQNWGLWPALAALLPGLILCVLILRYGGRSKSWLMARVGNIVAGFIIGWSLAFGHAFFDPALQENLYDRPLLIEGNVVELPQIQLLNGQQRIQLRLLIDSMQRVNAENPPQKTQQAGPLTSIKPLLQLSWYRPLQSPQPIPKPGERWAFAVKLSANHASMNLGGFDYESWLFQNHLVAKGYVLEKAPWAEHNRLVHANNADPLRFRFAQSLNQVFANLELQGLYAALTYGDKHAISDAQWTVLQQTGTIHLMAISGLHMGIAALLGILFFKGLWWLGLYRCERLNLPQLSVFGAILFATFYLILSGAAIPAQRAYLMVVAIGLMWFLKRTFQPWPALAFAALLVLFWDPRSVLSDGFWLSFLAVALIFATLQIPAVKTAKRWQQLLWIQLVLTLGLAPYLWWAYHFVPSISFVANLIAVPFVSFIGLPLLWLVSFVAWWSPDWAVMLMAVVDPVWQGFWQLLAWFATFSFPLLMPIEPLGLALFTALLFGVLYLFATQKRYRWYWAALGLALWPLYGLVADFPRPSANQLQVHLLDVGQGQAAVLETARHVLVYDTGARWGDKMDGAKLAILPFLRSRGWQAVDMVMVSHSDIDHAGGLARLLQEQKVSEVVSGQPQKVAEVVALKQPILPCYAGQSWQWDGVRFEVLWPLQNAPEADSDNDASCVLKACAAGQCVLLTGDLSERGEKRLLQTLDANSVRADLLIAGHHGSRYSSSTRWLEAVQPEVVLFSSGYHNRFQFPNRETLQRLPPNVNWYNTACSGGIGFTLGGDEFKRQPDYEVRKQRQKWYHHRCLEAEQGVLYQ